MTLSGLTSAYRKLALVGLAKNTGKTEALRSLLYELQIEGRRVGVTSVGRDGEARDVIDFRIRKPLIELSGGSLVATTDELLRASGIPHDLLEKTEARTPVGRVLIARLRGPGTIEIAGPSASGQIRAVSDAMLSHGAEQVLIDGAIDRRAASSPAVADGLVMSTGAVLGQDIAEVVAKTKEAVELVRLAKSGDSGGGLALAPQFPLTAEAEQVARLLDENPLVRRLLVGGALPEQFLDFLMQAAARRGREITLIVSDPTKVFIPKRSPAWYGRGGITLETLHPIELAAITINPVAPRSHRFDSGELRRLLREAIDIPVFDVMDSTYAGALPSAYPAAPARS